MYPFSLGSSFFRNEAELLERIESLKARGIFTPLWTRSGRTMYLCFSRPSSYPAILYDYREVSVISLRQNVMQTIFVTKENIKNYIHLCKDESLTKDNQAYRELIDDLVLLKKELGV